MAYTALYRRFRPVIFEQIIGQDEIVQTLKNQISNDNIAHAYLFIGSRGTGKTTSAKIFSRAINCLAPLEANPCNQCTVCQSILKDANMDVIEMDAASNNGVDDIRELREIVKFPPSSAKYKVVIIDEVHMLSRGAFNALLKTLEEPPAYMVFILATTEPHKVPATIISRCQRFDFKRIAQEAMLKDLEEKCKELAVDVESNALELIVRLAEGAMRDAQSLLDQCLSYSGNMLSYQEAARILGRESDQTILELAEALLTANNNKILEISDIHQQRGKDPAVLLVDLIAIFRVAMRKSYNGNYSDKLLPPESIARIEGWLKSYASEQFSEQLALLLSAYQKLKSSPYPEISLELELLTVAKAARVVAKPVTQSVNSVSKSAKTVANDFSGATVKTETEKVSPTVKTLVKENSSTNSDLNSKIEMVREDKAVSTENKTKAKKPTLQQELTIDSIKSNWPDFMAVLETEAKTTAAMLREFSPVAIHGDVLELTVNDGHDMLKGFLEQDFHQTNLKNAFEQCFLKRLNITFSEVAVDQHEQDVVEYFAQYIDASKIIID